MVYRVAGSLVLSLLLLAARVDVAAARTAALDPARFCFSVAACAFFSNGDDGPGVAGQSAAGSGVVGYTSAHGSGQTPTVAAVYGEVRGTNPDGLVPGVLGIGAGVGAGVIGSGYSGVVGIGRSAGVFGQAAGTPASPKLGFGVVGLGLGGVEGFANGNLPGVFAFSTSATPPNAYALEALDIAGTATLSQGTIGVVASSYVYTGASPQTLKTATALELEAGTPQATSLLRGLDFSGKSVVSLDAGGNLVLAGTLTQSGSPQLRTRARDGSRVVAFGPRIARPTIEDDGEAQLHGGSAFVPLTRAFGQTLDPHQPYLVFITPEGDSRGLYVPLRSATGFTVRENAGGRSDTAFQYRIVGSPADTAPANLPAAATHELPTTTFPLHRSLVPSIPHY